MADGPKRNWYSTGYEAVDIEKERIARMSGPNRFWMKEGTKRELVFIDDESFNVHEHSPKLNGSFRNQFTCLQDAKDIVPCCEKLGPKSRYMCGYFTVIDLTENIDTKGNKYQYEIKLLPTKLKTLNLIKRKKQDRGSLIGCMFNVHRDSVDDANCGGEFEFKREADLEKLFKLVNYKGKKLTELYKEAAEKPETMKRLQDTFQLTLDSSGLIVPKAYSFNYMHVLAPKEPKEIRQMLGAFTPETAANGEAEAPSDDAIPF